ncbi:response regulator transcription factor [Actinosynnema sp. NPDC047251]|uniref:Transcriptional regulator n=1 Tax=Saccharothrix espanaensis (strain ATCC 51144 / DSM 44229 / JCM 9112 / NBRC 15066 / NRRL 15764) TaxID=1179773 RepID=K0JU19_SACES|nr:response regulator transcription factor [Saccharothrix espanaensis]CCH29421.1 Transcriptional regulator [Saccharothrix espanaensis DSM 44229]
MRVLVVEDDRRMAGLLVRGFVAENFAVDVEYNGSDGLWRATEHAYDVIVLDVMLPGLNGYRVCARLRAAGVWTPILMLTAKDGELDETEGLDTGADDYLTKPFSYPVLVARLRALVRRGGTARPAVLRAGDLELDPAARTCRRGHEAIALTAKEFAVLEHLLRRRDQVVTKSEIIAGVWDEAREPDPNLVEVYISTLRRKIDAPFHRHTITTVRGVGYRIDNHQGGSA